MRIVLKFFLLLIVGICLFQANWFLFHTTTLAHVNVGEYAVSWEYEKPYSNSDAFMIYGGVMLLLAIITFWPELIWLWRGNRKE